MPIKTIFIPHGGGPLPLLNDEGHTKLNKFLTDVPNILKSFTPDAILVISAHWEESIPSIIATENPSLLYDYYGFPKESYNIKYPVRNSAKILESIKNSFDKRSNALQLVKDRGFDHGVFVPLKVIYPNANIPTTQLSLVKGLDPKQHIALGQSLSCALEELDENILIIGSGMSFHNMRGFFTPSEQDKKNVQFEQWLHTTLTSDKISQETRAGLLCEWKDKAPFGTYCHPREEHLMPLFVCYGASLGGQKVAKRVFYDTVLNKQVSAYSW